jgi:hypothetical protein
MICEFNDGLRVSFCGPLRIKKEGEINVFLDRDEVWEEVPPNVQGELLEVALSGDCNRLRHAAKEVVETIGPYWADAAGSRRN